MSIKFFYPSSQILTFSPSGILLKVQTLSTMLGYS